MAHVMTADDFSTTSDPQGSAIFPLTIRDTPKLRVPRTDITEDQHKASSVSALLSAQLTQQRNRNDGLCSESNGEDVTNSALMIAKTYRLR